MENYTQKQMGRAIFKEALGRDYDDTITDRVIMNSLGYIMGWELVCGWFKETDGCFLGSRGVVIVSGTNDIMKRNEPEDNLPIPKINFRPGFWDGMQVLKDAFALSGFEDMGAWLNLLSTVSFFRKNVVPTCTIKGLTTYINEEIRPITSERDRRSRYDLGDRIRKEGYENLDGYYKLIDIEIALAGLEMLKTGRAALRNQRVAKNSQAQIEAKVAQARKFAEADAEKAQTEAKAAKKEFSAAKRKLAKLAQEKQQDSTTPQ